VRDIAAAEAAMVNGHGSHGSPCHTRQREFNLTRLSRQNVWANLICPTFPAKSKADADARCSMQPPAEYYVTVIVATGK
jgi:hypothetical protein